MKVIQRQAIDRIQILCKKSEHKTLNAFLSRNKYTVRHCSYISNEDAFNYGILKRKPKEFLFYPKYSMFTAERIRR
jgi:hypothetical protein